MKKKTIKENWKGFSSNSYIRAIRQGLVSLIPILMVGACALVLKSLPIAAYQNFICNFCGGALMLFFNGVYSVTFGLLSIYMTVSIAYYFTSYHISNKKRFYIPTIISALTYFVVFTGINNLTVDTLGPKGMFAAIFSALVAPTLFSAVYKKTKPVSLMADGSDVGLSMSLRSIVPVAVTIAVGIIANLLILTITKQPNIHSLVINTANKLFGMVGNNFLRGLLFILVSSAMWFFGIHGSDVLEGVCTTFFVSATSINIGLSSVGKAPTQILTKPFFDIFVLMGGCGSTMCLLIALLLFSKRKSSRGLARIAALPMIFNINEIMVFGLPVIYNPTLVIPFVGVPLICFFTTYASMAAGWVPMVTREVEWTTPMFINAYLATGSWRAVLLQAVNLIIGIAVYIPFVKKYDLEKLADFKKDYNALVDLMKYSEESRIPMTLTGSSVIESGFAKAMCADLSHAISKGEYDIFYQPQYDLSGNCLGAEALFRWEHPLVGTVYPPLVFKLADEAGVLEELEEQIFNRVVDDAKKLYADTKCSITISVNATGVSIQSKDFEKYLLNKVRDIPPEVHICIEVTEQAALKVDDELCERFKALHKAGYMLAIDDFSMGSTSLQYLQDNKFDIVKLDGALVQESQKNPRSMEIVSSIIQLSGSLGFDVVAEFVDNVSLRDMLAKIGCTVYQGWLYSPAVSLDTLMEKLK